MKRRSFLTKSSIAGMTGISGGLLHPMDSMKRSILNAQTGKVDLKKRPAHPKRILTLKGEYYCHYPVDFSLGKEAALGFHAWGKSEKISVPAEETALVLMHIWNVGISPDLEWNEKGPAGGVMLMAEWASRTVPMIKNNIPPILSAVRKANLPIIHVAAFESYASKYPGYQAVKNLAGDEPPSLPGAVKPSELMPPDDHKNALLFGERFMESEEYYFNHLDFPDQAKPLDSEPVVVTTHQFNSVLRERSIWQLIYCGFAINWCLWFMPGGMNDMSRLGYRCSCIREGVTAVENKLSARGELNKEQALWRTSLMFGYIHSSEDFIQACGKLGPGKS